MKHRPIQTLFILFLVTIFSATSSIIPAAEAVIIDTPEYLESKEPVTKEQLQIIFMREDVRAQLVALGVDPGDAEKRLNVLSSAELQHIQENIDTLPAGSSVLAVLGVVLIVLIVLELLGVTNVFTKL